MPRSADYSAKSVLCRSVLTECRAARKLAGDMSVYWKASDGGLAG